MRVFVVGVNEKARFSWIEDQETNVDVNPAFRVWTDDFSNLWGIRRQ